MVNFLKCRFPAKNSLLGIVWGWCSGNIGFFIESKVEIFVQMQASSELPFSRPNTQPTLDFGEACALDF